MSDYIAKVRIPGTAKIRLMHVRSAKAMTLRRVWQWVAIHFRVEILNVRRAR